MGYQSQNQEYEEIYPWPKKQQNIQGQIVQLEVFYWVLIKGAILS